MEKSLLFKISGFNPLRSSGLNDLTGMEPIVRRK